MGGTEVARADGEEEKLTFLLLFPFSLSLSPTLSKHPKPNLSWSPEYTLTEDFALGMELKKKKWECRYVDEYLAVGEAPEQLRNCFQQRSRWCKGHFQIMLSPIHCPLFQEGE